MFEVSPDGNAFYYVYLAVMFIITIAGGTAAQLRKRAANALSETLDVEVEETENPIVAALIPLLAQLDNVDEMKISIQSAGRFISIHAIKESAHEQR